MNQRYDLVYHCDAFPAIGTGHLKRALDVLSLLRRRRPEYSLAVSGSFMGEAETFLCKMLPKGVVRCLAQNPAPARVAVLDSMAVPGKPGSLDHHRAKSIRCVSGKLVLISSALDVEVNDSVDLVIDHLPYAMLTGSGTSRVLKGFEFAPVAPDVAREATVAPENSNRLAMIIGGGRRQVGPDAMIELLAGGFARRFAEKVMIVSPQYPSSDFKRVQKRGGEGLSVLRNVPSVASWLAGSAAVVCTYGNATFESLTLHRPTFTLNYAAFQDEYAERLHESGLVCNLGNFDQLRSERLTHIDSVSFCLGLHERSKKTFRGSGIDRIVMQLIEEIDSVQRS